jgi:hypothetical protein
MEKSIPIVCAIFVIFTKIREAMSRRMGENSPNLVTLPPIFEPTVVGGNGKEKIQDNLEEVQNFDGQAERLVVEAGGCCKG